MNFKNPYLTVESKIRMLQRWILVQSYVYYITDNNIVADYVYDMNAKTLVNLMEENPDVKTRFSYVFKNFKSGTGFDLIGNLKSDDKKIIERDANLAVYYSLFGRRKQ